MSGVVHEIQLESTEAQRALARLSPALLAQVSDEVGSLIEDQTKRRIEDDKTSPDGQPWAPWSPRHVARLSKRNRATARSLLVGEGDLRDSIQNLVTGTDIMVGTPVIYGAIHQFGGDTSAGHPAIPARPYLGLSIENATEVEELVLDRASEVLQ
jgi:phage virion morphogenesis protein